MTQLHISAFTLTNGTDEAERWLFAVISGQFPVASAIERRVASAPGHDLPPEPEATRERPRPAAWRLRSVDQCAISSTAVGVL
jgi:hypothetical protein